MRLLALLLAVSPLAHAKRVLPPGTWGGEHIQLEVTTHGAELELDCARGQIEKPLRLGRGGRLSALGTFSPEHGGPVLRDEKPHPADVRYVGRVQGDHMTLTITRAKEVLGTFALTRGAQPILRKCR